jgi:anti-anti-sigma factor
MWISEEGKTAIAHADATLTFSNRRELELLASDAIARGARMIVVDMAKTSYVDTAALGTLAMLAARLRRDAGALCLANVNAELRALLFTTKLDTVLPVAPAPARAD